MFENIYSKVLINNGVFSIINIFNKKREKKLEGKQGQIEKK